MTTIFFLISDKDKKTDSGFQVKDKRASIYD